MRRYVEEAEVDDEAEVTVNEVDDQVILHNSSSWLQLQPYFCAEQSQHGFADRVDKHRQWSACMHFCRAKLPCTMAICINLHPNIFGKMSHGSPFMQIAAQSSDEEEHYVPTGATGDVQSGANTGAHADAVEAQVGLL